MWLPLSSKWGQTRPADDDPRCHLLSTFNHGDLGHGMHEQFRVFPFIFNSFYQVGTPVCRTCRCQISIILQIKKTHYFEKLWKERQIFWGSRILAIFLHRSKEEAGSSRWKFVAIPTTPSPWFWSSWEPSSLQITICKGTAEHRGGRIMWMISCNNLCFSV